MSERVGLSQKRGVRAGGKEKADDDGVGGGAAVSEADGRGRDVAVVVASASAASITSPTMRRSVAVAPFASSLAAASRTPSAGGLVEPPSLTDPRPPPHSPYATATATATATDLRDRVRRLRSWSNAQYLYVTRKRLPFIGRQVDRFQAMPPHMRAVAFVSFVAWKFFMTFVVMGLLLKKAHSMFGTGTGYGSGEGLVAPPLRVLYVLTAFSAPLPPPPTAADDDLEAYGGELISWFESDLAPLLQKGLVSEVGASSFAPSSATSALDINLDVYLIVPSTSSGGRGFDLLSAAAELLPDGVGLELWENALPAAVEVAAVIPSTGRGRPQRLGGQQQAQHRTRRRRRLTPADDRLNNGNGNGLGDNEEEGSGALTSADRVALAQRHRHVVRDKLLRYDLFVAFGVGGGGVRAEHVRRYWALSEELRRAEEEGGRGSVAGSTARMTVPGFLAVEMLDGAAGGDRHRGGDATGTSRRREDESGAHRVDPAPCCGGGSSSATAFGQLVLPGVPPVSGGSVRRIIPAFPSPPPPLSSSQAAGKMSRWVWMMPPPSSSPQPRHSGVGSANATAGTAVGGWMATQSQLLRALSSGEQCRRFLPPFHQGRQDNDSEVAERGGGEEEYWTEGTQLYLSKSAGGCGMGRAVGTDATTFSGQLLLRRRRRRPRRRGAAAVAALDAGHAVGADDFLARVVSERKAAESRETTSRR